MPLTEVTTPTLEGLGDKAVVLFGASWHEACAPLEAILEALQGTAPGVSFAKADAEENEALAEAHGITAVPTLLFREQGNTTKRLEGGIEPATLTVAVRDLAASSGTAPTEDPSSTTAPTTTTTPIEPQEALTARLEALIRGESVMLFMKGVPTQPRCGFSRQAVELLNEHGVPFGSFDILSDEEVRQGLKKHSDWPTYPQVYAHGELQGGLDVLKELAEDGNLAEAFGVAKAEPAPSLDDKLAALVKRSPVMVFLKGLPSAPRCGFSRQLVELLDTTGVPYDAFDILQDEEVRQGLKAYSDWPTYPQLYANGELVGGLDICRELAESGDLLDALQG